MDEGDGQTVRVLVVDDERAVRESLDRALRLAGYEVSLASDGLVAIRSVAEQPPDAIVLDVTMPGPDGLAVARRLRGDGLTVPILMLTARDAIDDRVAGLDAGADDYLVKPFALEELLARIRALLRRTLVEGGAGADRPLVFADLVMDPVTMEIRRGDRRVELTRTEWMLLEVFLRNPERVLSRDIIHDRVWGFDASASSNSLEVYMGYLRRKLEAAGEPRLLHTVRGFGYVLRRPEAA
ncbi:MAG TPA: response regulator transcription factor [Euzebyales bacterium]|nr:response regulator transcription factor [Euzebyales bacterium]